MSKIREIGVDLAKAKKYSEAMYLLEKAACNGDMNAINDMGVVHERNKNYEIIFHSIPNYCNDIANRCNN